MEDFSTLSEVPGTVDLRQSFHKRHVEVPPVFEKRRRKETRSLGEIVHDYFNKKFTFQNSGNHWCLTNVEEMFVSDPWEVSELQNMKQHLNEVKSQLNDFDLDDWHRHTRFMNKAGNIQWKLKKEYEPEFVTQAWCKFYEIVMSFPLVPPDVEEKQFLNSFHLCEAPGAFVTSLNHFLKLHFPNVKWQWMATTLNPYYEGNTLANMINDDRFILQTLSNWTFGEDLTGNLMDVNNMMHLTKDVEKMGDILLVTADGSIDCQENPGEQEIVVSQLHYCEIVTALYILAPGGSFLLKLFTLYEVQTICLLYLLCCVFEQVNIFKPGTSKEGNSEVYAVCLRYRGKEQLQPWLSKLREYCGVENPKYVMFPKDRIPEDFIQQVISCAELFKNFQVDVIENNILNYKEKTNEDFVVKQMKYLVAEYFMDHYKMQRLADESKEVVGKAKLINTPTFNLEGRVERGSYSERCRLKILTPLEQLMTVHEEAESINLCWSFKSHIEWLEFPLTGMSLRVVTGKPVEIVHCSKFCIGSLLKLTDQVEACVRLFLQSANSASRNLYETLHCNDSSRNRVIEFVMENYPDIAAGLKILDFRAEFRSVGEGTRRQKTYFLKITRALSRLKEDENLLFLHFAMLSQFNVGIVYLLSHLFKKVGFIKPLKQDFGLIFVGFCSTKTVLLKFFDHIHKVLQELEDTGGDKNILSIIPINQICGNHLNLFVDESLSEEREEPKDLSETGPLFYQCVTEVNNLSVKEHILETVSHLKHVL